MHRATEQVRAALCNQLAETVNHGGLVGIRVINTVVAESPHMMRLAARVGERGLVHSTALGKAMCAELPADRVRSILKVHGMPARTEATITEPDAYLEELLRVRAQGWAVDDEENQVAGRCLAVVIPSLDFPAAVSVSAPIDRMPADRIP